jgi:hypothetical protein
MARTADSAADAALARVRQICFGFAGTEEKLSHGSPWFHVRGKMFVAFVNDHHGDGRLAVWCKATPDEQRRLVREAPERYFVPPYVGVKGWVGVRLDHPETDLIELAIIEENGWLSVAPKSFAGRAPSPPPPPPEYPKTDPEVAAAALARLTSICDTFPESVTERTTSHATYRVRNKVYAYFVDNHYADGKIAVCFKADSALVATDPARFYLPPYIGSRGYVGLRLDTRRVDWKKVLDLVEASYRATAPKRLLVPSPPR